ncbi:DUF4843 domain-containing protein [Sphingobacterium bambusae]|uniref:DUF4843 domain-containing protein n=1 Tax=Sphingobacterium bambusae TaxID=662858 RepID=A0ABW6BJB2_9SPHI|nr:DUF4843 domain-containing protein [Sphingobacterium bambusae]WPL49459.1 DUF4843 domain-containing protein [Sphingobacterium bambusae]
MRIKLYRPLQIVTYVVFMAVSSSVFVSCEKEYVRYESDDYVKFAGDTSFYTFYTKPSNIIEDTVKVRIDLIGKVSSEDRAINLVVDDSTNAVEGVDFKIQRPVVLKEGAASTTANVILYRTGQLKTQTRTIWLSIKDDTSLKRAQYKDDIYTTYKVAFSDQLKKPSWWDLYFTPMNILYSSGKMQFYIDVIGTDLQPLYIPGDFPYVLFRLKTAVLEYRAQNGDYPRDENGDRISWGD